MKAKLIIVNWVFAWAPLCYAGDDPFIALLCVSWFGLASRLLEKNKTDVSKEMNTFNKWIDKQINKQNNEKKQL